MAGSNQTAPQVVDDELPPWLREDEQEATQTAQPTPTLIADQHSAAPREAQEQPSQPAATDDELPLWLQDLAPTSQSADLSAPPTELPPWLADDTPSATAEPPTETATNEASAATGRIEHHTLPPWLDTSASSKDTTAWQPPSWLAADEPSAVATPTSEIVADTQSNSPSSAPSPDDETLPDWLRDLDTAPQDARVTPALGSPVVEQEAAALPSAAAHDHRPATDLQAQEELVSRLYAEQPAPPPEPTPTPSDSLPDWLHDDANTTTASQTASTSDASDLPDWLRDDVPAAPANSATEREETQTVPSWLRDDPSATSSPTPTATQQEPVHSGEASAALPAWTREEASVMEIAPSEAASPTDEPSTVDRENVPAWLRNEPEASSIAEPEWKSRLVTVSWLTDDTSTPVATQTEPIEEEPAEQAALPAGLRGDDLAAPAQTEAGAATTTDEPSALVKVYETSATPTEADTSTSALPLTSPATNGAATPEHTFIPTSTTGAFQNTDIAPTSVSQPAAQAPAPERAASAAQSNPQRGSGTPRVLLHVPGARRFFAWMAHVADRVAVNMKRGGR
jgi:hypothetical protein